MLKDGGPAFPRAAHGQYKISEEQSGMLLRDYYAGQALAAAMMGGGFVEVVAARLAPDIIAEHCWRLADAMIMARGR